VVAGAHYDTVVGSPGADDNASGVSALIEIARAFRQESGLKRRLQLAAYDHEETGFPGSDAHGEELRAENAQVVGMMSLEMMGYTSTGQTFVRGVRLNRTQGDFLAIVADAGSARLLQAFDDER
jgi:Zn-dependent M28 family amino/carboxypeptidase